ncbi:MAG: polyphosphate polymerase domain-containing protein [Anaerolineae bacterium]|nr:polyphosphate polymerase domain-containing protein [Anaerolineae bacterium]
MPYRQELKYLINEADVTLMRLRLSSFMKKDEHINADGNYTVRSLYFDDYYNSAYNEKYMGALDRQKYRIRFYNYLDSFVQLERKTKWNSYIDKQTSQIKKEDVLEVINNRFSNLLNYSNDLQKIFYFECLSNVMRPRVIVDYEREPFVFDHGNVRVTFDLNVRAAIGSTDVFDQDLPTIPLLERGQAIMEVKYTEFLPNLIRNILPPQASNFIAVSKYILGCDATIYNRFSNY